MSNTNETKLTRLSIRVSAQQKEVLSRAASYRKTTVSNFVCCSKRMRKLRPYWRMRANLLSTRDVRKKSVRSLMLRRRMLWHFESY